MTNSLTGSETQPSAQTAGNHTTTHTVIIGAPAKVVYDIIADVTRWPFTFGPTVHAEVFETDGSTERLRLWAFANGAVRTWTSRRTLDPEGLTVRFEQEKSAAPVVSMGGEWRIEEISENATRVDLLHHFRTATPDTVELVWTAVENNSNAELDALKRTAEQGDDYHRLLLQFSDSVTIDGAKQDVYDFLHAAELWPQRLPHVARLDLTEAVTGVQAMEMDTRSTDGSIHTTHSVRVCFPNDTIVYKQTATPAVMAAHTGKWTFVETPQGVVATSHHTVVIRPEKVTEVLGPEGTLDQARVLIQKALSTNSCTTLQHAKAFAENKK